MHHAKNHGNKEMPLAILSRILAQSCVTLCLNICRKGLRMIVLVSLIVLLKGFPCFHDFFCMVHLIPTSPFIQLNDFCTCSTYFLNKRFACTYTQRRACIHVHMRRLAIALRLDHVLVQ